MPDIRDLQSVRQEEVHMVNLSPEIRNLLPVKQGEVHMVNLSMGNKTIITNPLPPGGNSGDLLIKKSDGDYDVEWVAPANSPEQDNTRPITAAAVYTEIGNINALLETI
jgi:hypothetical protein